MASTVQIIIPCWLIRTRLKKEVLFAQRNSLAADPFITSAIPVNFQIVHWNNLASRFDILYDLRHMTLPHYCVLYIMMSVRKNSSI